MKNRKELLNEFVDFVREKGVIGLAVGIVVGNAITKYVAKIVEDLISPIIGYITGSAQTLAELKYKVPYTSIEFLWGDFLLATIDFLVVMLVVYFVFVKSPINKLDKKKE
jgi:large conductance mechanosensitive channel